MRWRSNRHSKNIVDRRAGGGNRLVGGGIGTIVVILAALYFGIDPSFLIEGMQTASVSDSASHPKGEDLANDPLADRVSRVIADTEQVWQAVFAEKGQRYEEPRLVLFRGATRSACGLGEAAMGPFYCPADQNAYIDLGFYQELEQRFGAPGDFAQAYVIAHEIGHHVQNLLGISGEVQKMRQRLSEPESNSLSVRLELQADCLAGVWAKRSQNLLLEEGDLEEALNAASAIGDDRLQRQTRGTVTPDSFTHGTSEQRRRWFKRGLEQGEPDSCDTFSTGKL
ncbi:MAG: zinc metallopeptidase [Gammaproteobacteria bacterium]|nr:zinc metallopeptidase [Gammaproteobacteria bacterium]MDH5502239.1 zinc metallopeptidase [Gammaproteobacteria bacterium]